MPTELELAVAWQRHVGTGSQAEHWFHSVLSLYRSPGRHYHDARHLAWVVRHIAGIAETHPLDDIDAVVAAGFFHDAVYEPARSDNEAESAALARRALGEIGWEAERRAGVAMMVHATARHDIDRANADTQVLLAADLAVLASEPARYADYALAVRKEYAHLSDEAWRTGRSEVLRNLLDRPHLFATRLGLDDWERRARANIASELAQLVM